MHGASRGDKLACGYDSDRVAGAILFTYGVEVSRLSLNLIGFSDKSSVVYLLMLVYCGVTE
jgi:hypothetical protein